MYDFLQVSSYGPNEFGLNNPRFDMAYSDVSKTGRVVHRKPIDDLARLFWREVQVMCVEVR